MFIPEITKNFVREQLLIEINKHHNNPESMTTPNNDITCRLPDFQLKDSYTIDDFTQFDDLQFIRNAYRGILHREPDRTGLDNYLQQLHAGRRSKTEILSTLRFSQEGQRKDIHIAGLKKRFLLFSVFQIPGFGYLAKSLYSLCTLPRIRRQILQMEAHFSAQITHLQQENFHLQKLIDSKQEEHNNKLHKQVLLLQELIDCKQEESDKRLHTVIAPKADGFDLEKLDADKASRDEVGEIRQLISDLKQQTIDLSQQLQIVDAKTINDHKELLQALDKLIDNTSQSPLANVQTAILNQEKEHLFDAIYVAFEEKFRGSRTEIKKRLSHYIPEITQTVSKIGAGVLDLGCGRGEWLETLNALNIEAEGIDSNRIMVQRCQEIGLNVAEADAINYLSGLESCTLAVVTGFHIIEHLPFTTQVKLMDETLRVLKPGGVALFETPNPENILVGAHFFYSDPSHRNPLVPDSLKFFMEQRGFKAVKIQRLHKYSDYHSVETSESLIKDFMCSEMDFAVSGRKV